MGVGSGPQTWLNEDFDGGAFPPSGWSAIDFDGTCALRIDFTGGAGAASHSLWEDGAEVATGVGNPVYYSPGDSASHDFQIEASSACGSALSNTIGSSDPDCNVAALLFQDGFDSGDTTAWSATMGGP